MEVNQRIYVFCDWKKVKNYQCSLRPPLKIFFFQAPGSRKKNRSTTVDRQQVQGRQRGRGQGGPNLQGSLPGKPSWQTEQLHRNQRLDISLGKSWLRISAMWKYLSEDEFRFNSPIFFYQVFIKIADKSHLCIWFVFGSLLLLCFDWVNVSERVWIFFFENN